MYKIDRRGGGRILILRNNQFTCSQDYKYLNLYSYVILIKFFFCECFFYCQLPPHLLMLIICLMFYNNGNFLRDGFLDSTCFQSIFASFDVFFCTFEKIHRVNLIKRNFCYCMDFSTLHLQSFYCMCASLN